MRRAGMLLLAGVVLAVAAGPGSLPTAHSQGRRVVVQATSAAAAAEAVRTAGGRVVQQLPIADGVVAVLPAGAALRGAVVSPDAPLRPASIDTTTSTTAPNVYRHATRATDVGPARSPVTVALIDTGISPVGGLGAKTLSVPDPMTGQPAACANFSSEKGDCADNYGHGTFLAGLIAGDGAYPGMDPAARLVSIKVAGRDGAADTSQVLAAIQYAVSFKDQLGIKVLNLSLGSDSTHDYRKDPLNRAVEKAWRAGLVVVVAASNRGPGDGTTSKPADDPLVVTVGAVDDHGTTSREDDTVPSFSGRGPVVEGTGSDTTTVFKPDVVAPGVGLVSLAVPGSHIEQTAPPSNIPGYRRGSGTSQATAVVSGAVALLLERRAWTPDEVKAALYAGAHRISDLPFKVAGAGLIDVEQSLEADVSGFHQADPRQDAFEGLDLSRAAVQVTSFSCDVLRQTVNGAGCGVVSGQLTALATITGPFAQPQLQPFDASGYAGGEWTGQSWYASQWAQGQSWYGQSWYGQSWYGQSWYEQDTAQPSQAPDEGTATDFGTVLPGSAWYGVWN
ncbi:MAG: peptidase and in kexin sedolisin [Frankiales bacterium]|nr:peptidase and in kexin sedolisin [Frankiales bacterium]